MKKMDELPEILTAKHIAEYLGISRRRVYELFQLKPKHGGIPNFDIGFSKRVYKEDLKNWIENRKEAKKLGIS
ncbi:helix-turn-helix domain-containing protein [Bacillus shivajii]|uniref:helix-turn-helix domain-containing protein n=1 Tax=Bacillus shivajii TaxID=1983719 RepID=UPI001CFC2873|nr:helix-turn-helix domain-containing protein [Bacillus shivajii]UCZ53716.1 helix-turn-helix domain-containing protein [Bacillus shivajii]